MTKPRVKIRRPCRNCGCRQRLLKADGSIKRCRRCHTADEQRRWFAGATWKQRNPLLDQILKNQYAIRRRAERDGFA